MNNLGMPLLRKGITVLICTFNGEKRLPSTLLCLANQKIDANIEWEILLIDNCCSDNSVKVASETWNKLNIHIPLRTFEQDKRGKDNAIELGLNKARYSYVIICDDDNWLDENYIQLSYGIMSSNPEIGILGGNGTPTFEKGAVVPKWFNSFTRYYAIGPQNYLNGEISHYWPIHRFIWGAGAVINLEAYSRLKSCQFKRILAFDTHPEVARSEDVELSLAIWLAGYKLWYDERLTFQHFISNEKLSFRYLIKIIKQSISSLHYLQPYQVLIFSGPRDAPEKSYWKDYIIHFLQVVFSQFRRWKDFKLFIRIITNRHLEEEWYVNRLIIWYRFRSIIALWRKYDELFKRTLELQKRLTENKPG